MEVNYPVAVGSYDDAFRIFKRLQEPLKDQRYTVLLINHGSVSSVYGNNKVSLKEHRFSLYNSNYQGNILIGQGSLLEMTWAEMNPKRVRISTDKLSLEDVTKLLG